MMMMMMLMMMFMMMMMMMFMMMMMMTRYEAVLGDKLALDTEIAVYKALLDGEERRVARWPCR